MSFDAQQAEAANRRALTPFERDTSKRRHKNDSSHVDRIFTEQFDDKRGGAFKGGISKTPNHHHKSVDFSNGFFVRGLTNLKNEDQLEEVFAPEYLKNDADTVQFMTVKQKQLSPESIKR